jgi:metallo-beta-lactamase family protein
MLTRKLKIDPEIKIQFLGGAGTVTGSKYLVKTDNCSILIDCGLFQGKKELRELNWQQIPVNANSINYVLLTHAHLDHCGYLPKLVNNGFKGEIWGTAPTLDVARIILEDSARIAEEDTEKANREKFTKHFPALPLYTVADVEQTGHLFRPQAPGKWIRLNENSLVRFRYNGHILGAAFIELKIGNKFLVFSGDVGRPNDTLLFSPKKPERADVLFIESTYGERIHSGNAKDDLANAVNNAANKNGTILIPSFAVERIQTIMLLLLQLKKEKKIPMLPVYMDSPMGKSVFDLFEKYSSWHKLDATDRTGIRKNLNFIETVSETKALALDTKPKIIIAASGMGTGGRILTYFAHFLGDANATILFTGYQAEGTRGRTLLDGASQLKLFGKYFPVKATITSIESLSAHADQNELIDWLSKIRETPGEIFIVHGENNAAVALQHKLKQVYGWNAAIPILNQEVCLNGEFEMK